MDKTNFKKRSWWAIGGAVVLLAVIMVVLGAVSSPLPDTNTDVGEGVSVAGAGAEDGKEDDVPVIGVADDTTETKGDTGGSSELPVSGPVEIGMGAILLAGGVAYGASLKLGDAVRARRGRKQY